MKPSSICCICIVVALAVALYLFACVIPYKVVATLDMSKNFSDTIITRHDNGITTHEVFSLISTTTHKGRTRIASHRDYVVDRSSLGVKALVAWWPFGMFWLAIGTVGGIILAPRMMKNGYREASRPLNDEDLKLEKLLAQREIELLIAQEQVERQKEEAQQLLYTYQRQAIEAWEFAQAAESAKEEAERKLINERERHKDRLNKAGARVAELKKRSKKVEVDNT